jgi:hypothetical protein
MTPSFIFTAANQKRRYYFWFAVLLLIINYIFFFLFAYNRVAAKECTLLRCILIPAALIAVGLVYGWRSKKRGEAVLYLYIIAAALWVGNGQYIAAAVMAPLALLYYFADKDFTFRFTNEHITISTFPPRKYVWTDLQNVILKDGILTIDQKNNRIFQMDLSEEKLPFEEGELTGFCGERLG